MLEMRSGRWRRKWSDILDKMIESEIIHLKPVADKIMRLPGNARGNAFITDADFITAKEGKEGLQKLEEALFLLEYPFSYQEVRRFDWMKESQSVLGIFVAKKIFGWSNGDLFAMGFAAPSTSVLIKVALRFVSLENTFLQAPSVWERHYDFGSFVVKSFDEKEKFLSFEVRDYPYFEWMEKYFDGFFTKMMQVVGIEKLESLESSPGDNENSRLYEVRWL